LTATNGKSADEAQIRELFDDWVKAIRSKDVKGSQASYAPDVLLFDLVNPLQYSGLEALGKRLEEWFASFQGPIGYEIFELSVNTGDDAAFCHSLNRVNGIKTDGAPIDMWWRSTVCLHKRDGQWMVTHEHSSVPFELHNGKAALDLKP